MAGMFEVPSTVAEFVISTKHGMFVKRGKNN